MNARFAAERAAAEGISRNIAIHDRIARKYEARHDEIFNDREQSRLAALLEEAKAAIKSRRKTYRALDFGCGSGNLSSHLLRLGFAVTAADVSTSFLDLVRGRYAGQPIAVHRLNGRDLHEIDDASFELVATYSVLHHIPDYLAAVAEMGRVCAPGGVVVIDHEHNAEYWQGRPEYRALQKQALRPDWAKFLRPSNYFHKLRRLFDPRHTNEGDIHVWPGDHIEWDKVAGTLGRFGFEPVIERDYLLYRSRYRREVYDRFAGRCTDSKAMVFRKRAA
jgi:ubiquinone/menaquinone biosynthesis C-methylase UbiE